jgi:hypothetical protein
LSSVARAASERDDDEGEQQRALSIAFLVIWFFLSAKSPIGTVVDSLPGLAAIAYFSRSRRVRNTFTNAATNNDLH